MTKSNKIKKIMLFVVCAAVLFALDACAFDPFNEPKNNESSVEADHSISASSENTGDLSGAVSETDVSIGEYNPPFIPIIPSECDCDCSYPSLLCDPETVWNLPIDSLPAEYLPEADTTQLGKTVSSVLSGCCRNSSTYMVYYCNADTAKERLVIINDHNNADVALMSVYETDFGGGRGFYETVKDGDFDAKLIGNLYIYHREGLNVNLYIRAVFSSSILWGFFRDERVFDADSADSQMLFCSCMQIEENRVMYFFKKTDSPSNIVTATINSLENLYERYGLEDLVLVSDK